MKQILNNISNQPESVQNLISNMMCAAMQKREVVSRLELDDKQKAFLREEGFAFSFNKELFEWEVIINETGDK